MNSIGICGSEQVDRTRSCQNLPARKRSPPPAARQTRDCRSDRGSAGTPRTPWAAAPHSALLAPLASTLHHLALEREALRDGLSQELRRAIGGVVAAALMRGGDVKNMVDVVVPLRGVEIGLARRGASSRCGTLSSFSKRRWMGRENRARMRAASSSSRSGRESSLMAWTASKPKPVEMKLLEPIFGVLDEEVAHGPRVRPVKLDRVAPGRLVPAGEEVGRIKPEEVPFGTEVVVNDVEQHRDSALVRSLDKGLEVLGSSVARVRGVGKGSVVAPVPPAFEVADRHDLDGRDPEVREVVQFKGGYRKHALRRESADMEFRRERCRPIRGRFQDSCHRYVRGSILSLGPLTSSG